MRQSGAMETFDVGRLLVIECGSYDDLEWIGPLRVMRPFSMQSAAVEFVDFAKAKIAAGDMGYSSKSRRRDFPYPFNAHTFAPWLLSTGYVEPVDCAKIHVGDDCALDVHAD